MLARRHLGAVLVAAAWTAVCAAQSSSPPVGAPGSNPAPCSVAPEPQPCSASPTAPGGSTPEKFPFPGEPGAIGPSAPSSPSPTLNGVPDAPAGGSPTAPAKKDASQDFPFPGETSTGAGDAAGAGSSSSSSSSSDAAPPDPNAPGLKDEGSEGSAPPPGRHLLHRVNPVGTKLQTIDEREQEDLDVAHFYVQSGDLQGAYLRSQDAVKVAPDDPDAHFALAEIALKLNKKDEAIVEYTAVLKYQPTAKQARDAHKALARLKP